MHIIPVQPVSGGLTDYHNMVNNNKTINIFFTLEPTTEHLILRLKAK